MPVPVAAAAKTMSALATAGQAVGPRGNGNGPAPGSGTLLLLLPVVGVLALVVGISMLSGAVQQSCTGAGDLPAPNAGPGSLGGVGGTGISRELVERVRTISPYAGDQVTPGTYTATAYGPPWGGIQGAGLATSGGLPIGGGAPHWYMIATSPGVISHGTFVYIWPNPFRWRGPFFAADTGGAIVDRRIDFYDWRGRASQGSWGLRSVKVSAQAPADLASGRRPRAERAQACGAPVALSSRVGIRIGQLARSHLGAGPSISGFAPESVSYFWCAWFATNVWRKAGVPTPISAFSGYLYSWAETRGLLFKKLGAPPRGPTPPVGSALMYGDSPADTSRSWHVNLVDRVLPDGSFMVTGGNQDGGRVTRYGPCRLQHVTPAYLAGIGCDPRSIYGIAMPAKPTEGAVG